MGSKYYGEQNYFGNERAGLSSSSSSSSSKKGKKNSSDKPKQPQRGLGVAQLEKIRLHSQLGCNYIPPVHNPYASSFNPQDDTRLQTSYSSSSSPTYGFQPHHAMMGLPADIDRSNLTYGESQSTRWHPGNAGYESQHFVEPNMTQSFFEHPVQGSFNKKNRDHHDFMGSSGQNSDSNNPQEIDLELRLSL